MDKEILSRLAQCERFNELLYSTDEVAILKYFE